MPAQVPELPDDVVVLGSYRGGVGADQHMTAPGAVQQLVRQLPAGPRAKPAGQPTPAMGLLRSGCHGAPSPDRPWRGPALREATTVIGAGRGGKVCARALARPQLRGQQARRERHRGRRLSGRPAGSRHQQHRDLLAGAGVGTGTCPPYAAVRRRRHDLALVAPPDPARAGATGRNAPVRLSHGARRRAPGPAPGPPPRSSPRHDRRPGRPGRCRPGSPRPGPSGADGTP